MSQQDFYDDGFIEELGSKSADDLTDEEVLYLFDYQLENPLEEIRLGRGENSDTPPKRLVKKVFEDARNAYWRLNREPGKRKWGQEEVENELRAFEHMNGRPPSSVETSRAFTSNPVYYVEDVSTHEELLEESGMPYRLSCLNQTLEPEEEELLAEKYLEEGVPDYRLKNIASSKAIAEEFRKEYDRWMS